MGHGRILSVQRNFCCGLEWQLLCILTAGAANSYGELEESLDDDELGENVEASGILRLLS